jgi:hypothetical protein
LGHDGGDGLSGGVSGDCGGGGLRWGFVGLMFMQTGRGGGLGDDLEGFIAGGGQCG